MSKAMIYASGTFIGFDLEGKPLSYGTVEFTNHETGEVVYSYANSARTEVNRDPVELSASGKANIYLDPGDYNVVMKDQYGAIIETLSDFSPGGGGGTGGGGYQGEYTPTIGNEYPEDNPDNYGDFWSLAIPWTFQTGDLAGEVGAVNDLVMWSVNGWTLMELGFDTSLFLKIDGSNPMVASLDVGLHKVINMIEGVDDRDGVNIGQLNAHLADIWKQDQFIDVSAGVVDVGKPIKTNTQGKVDASFLELELFVYKGEHDPRTTEYPPITGLNPGDFYTIDLPVGTTYEFTTGNLIGKVVKEGDALIFITDSPEKWGIVTVSLEATDYVKVDGSHAMQAPLSLGNNKIINLAPAELDNEAVTKGQMEDAMKIPVGMIVMWSGNFTDIPDTWALCNGQNGTPNLSNRFILGTNQESEVRDVGGDNSSSMPLHTHSIGQHTHTASHGHSTTVHENGGHAHTFSNITTNGTGIPGAGTYYGEESSNTSVDGLHSHHVEVLTNDVITGFGGATATGNAGGTGDNMPSYMKLAFIIKV